MGNWSGCLPSTTSVAAVRMASPTFESRRPSSTLTRAAARLIRAWAWISFEGIGIPLIGKFSTARWVCAP